MFAYAKPEQKQDTKSTVQKKEPEKAVAVPNQNGIPNAMKSQFENLSGFSFDDVRVHYNSDKPAQLQALAYTQSGQEKHLRNNLGRVVQQKQGEFNPNLGVSFNTDSPVQMKTKRENHGVNYLGISYTEKSFIKELEPDDFVTDEFKSKHLCGSDYKLKIAEAKTKNREDGAAQNTVFFNTKDFTADVKELNRQFVLDAGETYKSPNSYFYARLQKAPLGLIETGSGAINFGVRQIDDLPDDFPNITLHRVTHLENIGPDTKMGIEDGFEDEHDSIEVEETEEESE